MAQAVNFFINLRVLFYVSVAAGNIGFWLVVVKIAHKIVDFVTWKELRKLTIELRG